MGWDGASHGVSHENPPKYTTMCLVGEFAKLKIQWERQQWPQKITTLTYSIIQDFTENGKE